jgi:hypothetical protein
MIDVYTSHFNTGIITLYNDTQIIATLTLNEAGQLIKDLQTAIEKEQNGSKR